MATALPPPSVNNTSLNEMVDDRVCAVVTPVELSQVVAGLEGMVAGCTPTLMKGLLEMQPLEGDLIFANPSMSRQISCSRRRCDPDSAVLLTMGQLRLCASLINRSGTSATSATKFACSWPFVGVFRNSIKTGQRYVDGVERSKWNLTVSRKAGIFGAFEFNSHGLPRVADSVYIRYEQNLTGLDVTLHTRPLCCVNEYFENRNRSDVEVPIGMILHSPACVPSVERMRKFKDNVINSVHPASAAPEMRQFPIVQVELGCAP